MTRILLDAEGRLHNHTELVYRPGERQLAAQVFETLGCRVEDPGGPYLVALVDPRGDDFYDNCLYASEMVEEQIALEETLRRDLEAAGELADGFRKYVARFEREPQRTTHFGIRMPPEQLEAAIARLESPPPELRARLALSAVFRPGDPGCLDENLIQVFLRTDVVAAGLTCLGQHIELQAKLS